MPVLLISYEAGGEGGEGARPEEQLALLLGAMGALRVFGDTWVMDSDQQGPEDELLPEELLEDIKLFLTSGGKALVLRVTGKSGLAAAGLPSEVQTWLEQRI
jgi:hypothetical protein